MSTFLPVLQVSAQLMRSPQPDFEDLVRLKGQGLAAVINLREEALESQFFSQQCGLSYLHLPVTDWTAPTAEQVRTFWDFLSQEQTGPSLIHCAAGVGRTGTFVACYRIANGMNIDQAIKLTDSESPLAGVTMNAQQHNFIRNFVM